MAKSAQDKADELLVELIRTQPGLIVPVGHRDARHGTSTADFIAALRSGLKEMYEKDQKPGQ